MDHFALKTDSLFLATQNQTLHRNFMGYTSNKTQLMIGLGMSAISDSWGAFAQNVKSVKEYQQLVSEGEIPVFRGHILTKDDLKIRKHILNMMCKFETSWAEKATFIENIDFHLSLLKELENDGLVIIKENSLEIPEHARPFVRNICMAFDEKLQQKLPQEKLFSQTI